MYVYVCVHVCMRVKVREEVGRESYKDTQQLVRTMWGTPLFMFLTDRVIAGTSKGRKRNAFLIWFLDITA